MEYKEYVNEDSLKRAQHAIDFFQKDECVAKTVENAMVARKFLQRLLNILRAKKIATITLKSGKQIDVIRVSNTYYYASFFDVYNFIYLVNTNIKPIQKNEPSENNKLI